MTVSRARRAPSALLGAGGVLLAASLFLSFFPGVSGWEHWDWVDVVFALLAAALVGAAVSEPRRVALLVALAVLCGLGVAVVVGHGFDGRGGADVLAGPWVALGGLAAGAFGASVGAWRSARGRSSGARRV